MIKRKVILLLVLSSVISALTFYGLLLMDVEDRYGDLQDLYWRSKDGDIILNKTNSTIGIIKLDHSRIYVEKGNKMIDFEDWLDPENKRKYQVAIYHPEHPIDKVENVSKTDIITKCKLVYEIAAAY